MYDSWPKIARMKNGGRCDERPGRRRRKGNREIPRVSTESRWFSEEHACKPWHDGHRSAWSRHVHEPTSNGLALRPGADPRTARRTARRDHVARATQRRRGSTAREPRCGVKGVRRRWTGVTHCLTLQLTWRRV